MAAERIEKAISSGLKACFLIGLAFVVAGFVMFPVHDDPRTSLEGAAGLQVMTLVTVVEYYVERKGSYPGVEDGVLPVGNAMPKLLDAVLFGCDPDEAYFSVKLSDLALLESQEGGGRFQRVATTGELQSRDCPKYLLDPWGRPYVYRLEKLPEGKIEVLIYSVGRNGKDESDLATRAGGDDLGNW